MQCVMTSSITVTMKPIGIKRGPTIAAASVRAIRVEAVLVTQANTISTLIYI